MTAATPTGRRRARPCRSPCTRRGTPSASLSPPSLVSAKRTSSSAASSTSFSGSTVGSPTCTSDARTGSVGARAAPSSIALAAPSPSPQTPNAAPATIVNGMASNTRRQLLAQLRHPTRRSIFNPAPISATITPSSVKRSVTSTLEVGSGESKSRGNRKTTTPSATSTIGNDKARRETNAGIHAERSAATPTRQRASSYRSRFTETQTAIDLGPSGARRLAGSRRLGRKKSGTRDSLRVLPQMLDTRILEAASHVPTYAVCLTTRSEESTRRTKLRVAIDLIAAVVAQSVRPLCACGGCCVAVGILGSGARPIKVVIDFFEGFVGLFTSSGA